MTVLLGAPAAASDLLLSGFQSVGFSDCRDVSLGP